MITVQQQEEPPEEEQDIREAPDPEDVFASTQTQTTEFVHRDFKVVIEHYELTRKMRYDAINAARISNGAPGEEGEVEVHPGKLEKQIVCSMVKSWNLPEDPSLGWDRLKDNELAERILEEIGVGDMMDVDSEGGGPEEVERGKNS